MGLATSSAGTQVRLAGAQKRRPPVPKRRVNSLLCGDGVPLAASTPERVQGVGAVRAARSRPLRELTGHRLPGAPAHTFVRPICTSPRNACVLHGLPMAGLRCAAAQRDGRTFEQACIILRSLPRAPQPRCSARRSSSLQNSSSEAQARQLVDRRANRPALMLWRRPC